MADETDAPTTADGEVTEEVDANFFEETLRARLNDLAAEVKAPSNDAEAKRLPVVVDAISRLQAVLDQVEWHKRDAMNGGSAEPIFTFTAEQLLQEFVSDKQLSREVKRRKAERAKAD